MSIIRISHNRENPYVMINKNALRHPNLSLKARGLWAYLLSYPDDWKTNVNHLSNVLLEGKRAIYGALDELIEHGFMFRYQSQDKQNDGSYGFQKVEYTIFEFPITDKEREEFEHEIQKKFARCGFARTQDARPQNAPILSNDRDKVMKTTTSVPHEDISDEISMKPQNNDVLLSSSEKKKENDYGLPLSIVPLPLFSPKQPYLKGLSEEEIHKVQICYEKSKVNIENPRGWITQCVKNGWYKEGVISDADLQSNFTLCRKVENNFGEKNGYTFFEATPSKAIFMKGGKEIHLPHYNMNHMRFRECIIEILRKNYNGFQKLLQ